jgi:hypothetical protein
MERYSEAVRAGKGIRANMTPAQARFVDIATSNELAVIYDYEVKGELTVCTHFHEDRLIVDFKSIPNCVVHQEGIDYITYIEV